MEGDRGWKKSVCLVSPAGKKSTELTTGVVNSLTFTRHRLGNSSVFISSLRASDNLHCKNELLHC